MPIDMYIDEERCRIVATVKGDFVMEDITEAVVGSVRDPRVRPGFNVYSDHTEVGSPLTTPDAKAMVGLLEGLSDVLAGACWAVVTANEASYGMMRMMSALAERVPMKVQVFKSHEEAESWLAAMEKVGR